MWNLFVGKRRVFAVEVEDALVPESPSMTSLSVQSS